MIRNNRNDNARIAKNTFFLYIRTFLILIVSLYTSREVLRILGVEDYGIYNAVGGFVAVFGLISGALSNAISRHITYALGKDSFENLHKVFCTSVNIQVVISLIILILSEIIGLWFISEKMNIPTNRIEATYYVFHFSLFTFVINLISLPYNALIIAHEHMKVYAYISILEAVCKLLILYLLLLSNYDRLVLYCLLLLIVSIFVRVVYGIYCNHNFGESKYKLIIDSKLFREMLSFAGWNFFTNISYVLNTQGVTLMVNAYFGVLMNSARGIAIQVDGAISQFVNNFTVAVNPQITKNYAKSDFSRMNSLICKGTKFAYFLLLIVSVPVFFEVEYLLDIWLVEVPDHTSNFIRLSILGALVATLGNCGYTACMATGNIRKYSIYITSITSLVFFFTWIAFYFGLPVESTYYIYILVYVIVQIVRLLLMKELLKFPISLFVKDVLLKLILPTIISFSIPYFIIATCDKSMLRLIISVMVSLTVTISSIYLFGLTSGERNYLYNKVKLKIRR